MESRHDYFQITDHIRNEIRKIHGKSANDMEQDTNLLIKWIKTTQPHLPEVPNRNTLEVLLLSGKCSVEVTKTIIDALYTLQSVLPEYFKLSPQHPLIIEASNTMPCLPLPVLTDNYYRVILQCFLDKESSRIPIQYFLANAANMQEYRCHEDYCNGDVYIVDLSNYTASHLLLLTPMVLMKLKTIMEKGLKHRVKGIHLLNPPKFIEAVLTIMRQVLSAKIVQRIHVHSKLETLYDHIPKNVLPKEYGGSSLDIPTLQEKIRKKFLQYDWRFKQITQMMVNEELRPKKLNNDEFLGYYGSFKTLDID